MEETRIYGEEDGFQAVRLPTVDHIGREDLASNLDKHQSEIVSFGEKYGLSYSEALQHYSPGDGWDALLEVADRRGINTEPQDSTVMKRLWEGSEVDFAIGMGLLQEAFHQNIAPGTDKTRRNRQYRALASRIQEFQNELITDDLRQNLSERDNAIIDFAINVRSLVGSAFDQPTYGTSPELDDDYTMQFPLASAISQRLPIVGSTYVSGYLDAPPNSRLRPNASGRLPSYKFKTDQEQVQTDEIGYILELDYAILRSTSITLASIMETQRMKAWQTEYNLVSEALQQVASGAEVYTGTIGATPTRKEFLRILFSRRGGINLSTVFGTLDAMVDYADYDRTWQGPRNADGQPQRVSWIDRMISNQNATIRGTDEVPRLGQTADGSAETKEQMCFYDKRYGVTYLVERGGDITETQRVPADRQIMIINSHNFAFKQRNELKNTGYLVTLG